MNASGASAHYEKLNGWFTRGLNNITQCMVDGAKNMAASLWTSEFRAKEKNLVHIHGAEWWELARKQYPISCINGEWVVTSNFAIDPQNGKRGPWHFNNEGQAQDKIVQLVQWLDKGRKKGIGDKDSDIQKWFTKLDAADKSKQMNPEKTL